MMCRRPALLITVPALLGLLHTAALADAGLSPEVAPRTGPGPTAPDVDLETTLDKLTARVQQLSQRAGAVAELTDVLQLAIQRLVQFEEATAADTLAVRQLLVATQDRIAELDAARAEDGALIARLQAELDAARAEPRALGQRLEASRRGLEELSAGLAAAVADLPRLAAAEEGEADRRGAGSSVIPPEPAAGTLGGPSAAAPAEGGGPGPCDGSIQAEGGDTLITIAKRCDTTVDALMEANPDIKDPRLIRVGQKIALPAS
jgi:hypothetical protein